MWHTCIFKRQRGNKTWWEGGSIKTGGDRKWDVFGIILFPCIVLNVFRSCYLNKLFCKFWMYFSKYYRLLGSWSAQVKSTSLKMLSGEISPWWPRDIGRRRQWWWWSGWQRWWWWRRQCEGRGDRNWKQVAYTTLLAPQPPQRISCAHITIDEDKSVVQFKIVQLSWPQTLS